MPPRGTCICGQCPACKRQAHSDSVQKRKREGTYAPRTICKCGTCPICKKRQWQRTTVANAKRRAGVTDAELGRRMAAYDEGLELGIPQLGEDRDLAPWRPAEDIAALLGKSGYFGSARYPNFERELASKMAGRTPDREAPPMVRYPATNTRNGGFQTWTMRYR